MELRILRGHEIKEAIKGIDDQIILDLLLDSYQKNLFFIGAFENDLIGAIGISHFQEIAYLWVEKNDHQKEIASKLRTAREKAGYKQEDIANILGVTPQKVSSFETGRTRVDVDTLVTLCKLYNVDANDIMGIAPPEKNPLDRLITVYTRSRKNLSQEEKMRLARIILSDDDEE